jgi:DNA modification methylase
MRETTPPAAFGEPDRCVGDNDNAQKPIARRGDVFLLGPHRLVCGDATDPADVALALAGAVPRLMVTDPPYGVSYDPSWRAELKAAGSVLAVGTFENDHRVDWREAWALFPGDVVYVWHAGLHTSAVEDSIRAAGFVPRAQIIWRKQHFAISRGHYHWRHEPCWYAVRKGRTAGWTGDRKQQTVWDIRARIGASRGLDPADAFRSGHATQKPVEAMKRPIVNHTQAGEAVYDPFAGSGTTIIAAEISGRVCHAIELEPAYVDVAVRRWEEHTGRRAVLEQRDLAAAA